uniref:Uncharacterized protein n=1 Tax=Arundo donax TaxID=35708 RepID=A0A0A9AF17_ARUDO
MLLHSRSISSILLYFSIISFLLRNSIEQQVVSWRGMKPYPCPSGRSNPSSNSGLVSPHDLPQTHSLLKGELPSEENHHHSVQKAAVLSLKFLQVPIEVRVLALDDLRDRLQLSSYSNLIKPKVVPCFPHETHKAPKRFMIFLHHCNYW